MKTKKKGTKLMAKKEITKENLGLGRFRGRNPMSGKDSRRPPFSFTYRQDG